tara:strand:+ start:192 stop:512 length:321 start_codon:yes stop_codon:yes gene_type:complete
MKVYDLKDYTRGWFIGDFEPSVFRTPDFEVGFLFHEKGENWPAHVHHLSDEFNVLVEGRMVICDQEINPGQIFVIEKGEVAAPTFLEDCKLLVVKAPSIPGDKHLV